MEIVDTLAFLLGTWHLDRSIDDHRSATCGSFSGDAALVEVEPDRSCALARRAHYDEVGELSFGSHRGLASRHLEYTHRDGAAVSLHFADGRPFVDLDLRRGTWWSMHRCGDDRYEIATVARTFNVVREHWRVRGPNKDYDAITVLMRTD